MLAFSPSTTIVCLASPGVPSVVKIIFWIIPTLSLMVLVIVSCADAVLWLMRQAISSMLDARMRLAHVDDDVEQCGAIGVCVMGAQIDVKYMYISIICV